MSTNESARVCGQHMYMTTEYRPQYVVEDNYVYSIE